MRTPVANSEILRLNADVIVRVCNLELNRMRTPVANSEILRLNADVIVRVTAWWKNLSRFSKSLASFSLVASTPPLDF